MAEQVYYIEADGTEHALTTTDVKFLRGEGLEGWKVTPQWEELSAPHSLFMGSDLGRRAFKLQFIVSADDADAVREVVAEWRSWFMKDVARGTPGTVRLVLSHGGTYWTPAAVAEPDWEGPQAGIGQISLSFEAPGPFWYYGTAVTIGTHFAGAGTIDLPYSNPGDYYAWPVHEIHGACGTPVIRNGRTGEMIRVETTLGAEDILRIHTNPPYIEYIAGGTAPAANYTGYAGTASRFFPLDIGGGTIHLSAAEGTFDYQAVYFIVKAGL